MRALPHPETLDPYARLTAIAELLAEAFHRLQADQNATEMPDPSAAEFQDSCLELSAAPGPHPAAG